MQFHPAEWEPRKTRGRGEIHRSHSVINLFAADLMIFQNLRLAIGDFDLWPVMRRPRESTQKLIVWPMFGPRVELRFGGLQVQVGEKESVVGNMPELIGIARGEPQRFGALDDRLREHLERRPVLLFQHFINTGFCQIGHPRLLSKRNIFHRTPALSSCTKSNTLRRTDGGGAQPDEGPFGRRPRVRFQARDASRRTSPRRCATIKSSSGCSIHTPTTMVLSPEGSPSMAGPPPVAGMQLDARFALAHLFRYFFAGNLDSILIKGNQQVRYVVGNRVEQISWSRRWECPSSGQRFSPRVSGTPPAWPHHPGSETSLPRRPSR